MAQKHFLWSVVALALIVLISGCVQRNALPNVKQPANITPATYKNEIIIARLINITDAAFSDSSGYYEGRLKLKDIKTNEERWISPCAKDWSWVKEGACYRFNSTEVKRNVESHRYSAELGGCYVGTLEQINCE